MTIQEMDLVIKHHAGKKNGSAEALSRIPDEPPVGNSSTVSTVTTRGEPTSDPSSPPTGGRAAGRSYPATAM